MTFDKMKDENNIMIIFFTHIYIYIYIYVIIIENIWFSDSLVKTVFQNKTSKNNLPVHAIESRLHLKQVKTI